MNPPISSDATTLALVLYKGEQSQVQERQIALKDDVERTVAKYGTRKVPSDPQKTGQVKRSGMRSLLQYHASMAHSQECKDRRGHTTESRKRKREDVEDLESEIGDREKDIWRREMHMMDARTLMSYMEKWVSREEESVEYETTRVERLRKKLKHVKEELRCEDDALENEEEDLESGRDCGCEDRSGGIRGADEDDEEDLESDKDCDCEACSGGYCECDEDEDEEGGDGSEESVANGEYNGVELLAIEW